MKTWLITGSSRGFGALIAELALTRGDNVVATARNPQAVADRFGTHPNLLAVALDVSSDDDANRAVAYGVSRFGRIDIVLNNAGFGLLGAVEEASAQDVETLYRTNVFGVLAVCRAALPILRQQRSGHIVNVSSIGGYRAGAGFGVYCSTKFAVEGLSEALAAELRPLGIFVTVIEPGYFRTDFLESSSLTVSARVIDDYRDTSGVVRARATEISGKQPGDPTKLASVVMKLVDSVDPPVRLPIGSDTVQAIREKHQADAKILSTWESVSVSTDYPR